MKTVLNKKGALSLVFQKGGAVNRAFARKVLGKAFIHRALIHFAMRNEIPKWAKKKNR